jgi:type VI secretion system protein VasD
MKSSIACASALLMLTACGTVRIAEPPPRQAVLRLHAAPALNTGPQGEPLALVARIYRLRQLGAFERASFDSLLNGSDLGHDVVEMREVTLVPGQRYETVEKLEPDVAYIGVAGLFHAPGRHQWRLAFTASDAVRSGITIGLYGCSMSAGQGARPTAGAAGGGDCD